MHYTIKLSQMRIGVDLDGVVADFTDGWTSQYEKDFGKKISENDITEWGLAKPLTHFEEEVDFWNWAKDIDGASIFRNLKTYNNAIEVLVDLSLKGHEIVIISSKPWWSIHDTLCGWVKIKYPQKKYTLLKTNGKLAVTFILMTHRIS